MAERRIGEGGERRRGRGGHESKGGHGADGHGDEDGYGRWMCKNGIENPLSLPCATFQNCVRNVSASALTNSSGYTAAYEVRVWPPSLPEQRMCEWVPSHTAHASPLTAGMFDIRVVCFRTWCTHQIRLQGTDYTHPIQQIPIVLCCNRSAACTGVMLTFVTAPRRH